MGKAPVLIKINSNKDRFLLLQSFPVCRGIFPRHILKEAAESTHTFKAQNNRYLFHAERVMQLKPFRFVPHTILYNLKRGRHTVGGK